VGELATRQKKIGSLSPPKLTGEQSKISSVQLSHRQGGGFGPQNNIPQTAVNSGKNSPKLGNQLINQQIKGYKVASQTQA
jgi:hypothetical protein